jgi:hypothetical protein
MMGPRSAAEVHRRGALASKADVYFVRTAFPVVPKDFAAKVRANKVGTLASDTRSPAGGPTGARRH